MGTQLKVRALIQNKTSTTISLILIKINIVKNYWSDKKMKSNKQKFKLASYFMELSDACTYAKLLCTDDDLTSDDDNRKCSEI